nr:retrovirus-related Pol polyprotein from transposon TNT 1-94 [Tanacetum cinerariifolium]GFB64062.1 retrovirus-related Pol polyprotein from transposon TNT 1-94 [Tanacetum cinerariifolium]
MAGLWLNLESLYMTKSLANKLRLKDRHCTFRMKPCISVQDHLDEFNTILIDLENLDVDIDDEDKFVLLFDDDVEPESGEGQVARGRSSDRGNHSLCYVVRKGNIQVKRHNGVVRTITGVRHIPDFKRNLISLSTLEANGCKYSGEDGVMKVFMGALVLMKAIQSGGLYVLQGEKGMKNLANRGLIKVSCNMEFC